MSESFAELFEESLNQTEMSAGQVVIGTVVDISDGYVTVSAGLKSEGVHLCTGARRPGAGTGSRSAFYDGAE